MESVEELIVKEIRDNYPFLYNVRDRKYRNREERDKAWAEIGSAVELDGRSCKTRWRSIRDRYLKERRRQTGSPERKRWRLVPMLGFLDDTLEAKMPRTPSVLKKRASAAPPPPSSSDLLTTTTTRRIILPAMALPSPASPSSSAPRPSPGAAATGVFPVSLLKAGGSGAPAECRRQPKPLPPPPALQPHPAITSTSLLLLPPQTTITTTSTAPDASAASAVASSAHGGDSKRKEMDPLGKIPHNLPQSLDEEDYYGLSVAGRLKKLSQRDRALVRIEIEKLFLKHET